MCDLRKAAAKAASWMESWLANDECDCDGTHICGRPKVQKDLAELRAALNEPDWISVSDRLPVWEDGELWVEVYCEPVGYFECICFESEIMPNDLMSETHWRLCEPPTGVSQ